MKFNSFLKILENGLSKWLFSCWTNLDCDLRDRATPFANGVPWKPQYQIFCAIHVKKVPELTFFTRFCIWRWHGLLSLLAVTNCVFVCVRGVLTQPPKPITNEEFQRMIPARFLGGEDEEEGQEGGNGGSGSTVTVTVHRPADAIQFPPAPTALGKLTETITKSTFTETVVTRVTDNKMVYPRIIEVNHHYASDNLKGTPNAALPPSIIQTHNLLALKYGSLVFVTWWPQRPVIHLLWTGH